MSNYGRPLWGNSTARREPVNNSQYYKAVFTDTPQNSALHDSRVPGIHQSTTGRQSAQQSQITGTYEPGGRIVHPYATDVEARGTIPSGQTAKPPSYLRSVPTGSTMTKEPSRDGMDRYKPGFYDINPADKGPYSPPLKQSQLTQSVYNPITGEKTPEYRNRLPSNDEPRGQYTSHLVNNTGNNPMTQTFKQDRDRYPSPPRDPYSDPRASPANNQATQPARKFDFEETKPADKIGGFNSGDYAYSTYIPPESMSPKDMYSVIPELKAFSHPKNLGYTGLPNIGNSCYL